MTIARRFNAGMRPQRKRIPKGRLRVSPTLPITGRRISAVPSGLEVKFDPYPALKRRAILDCPSGTDMDELPLFFITTDSALSIYRPLLTGTNRHWRVLSLRPAPKAISFSSASFLNSTTSAGNARPLADLRRSPTMWTWFNAFQL